MHSSNQPKLAIRLRWALYLVAFVALSSLSLANAQTFQVLHNFTGGTDGAHPESSLTMDRAGNFYGTTVLGGTMNEGVVFEMNRRGSGWTVVPLYSFQGTYDGAVPYGPVTIGPDGSLYGTTLGGGSFQGEYCEGGGCGVVFRLRPPAIAPESVITPWNESVLVAFNATDGNEPIYPLLLFDQAGNIYGTTQFGGSTDNGVVFELTPYGSGWTETVLYGGFGSGDAGQSPFAGVIMDSSGNLYGTASTGGPLLAGVAYELMPTQSGYQEVLLHSFSGDTGISPYAGLVMDQAGNLYGATEQGGPTNCGVIYELSPSPSGFTYNLLYALPCGGGGPYQNLVLDSAGNLFGAAYGDGA